MEDKKTSHICMNLTTSTGTWLNGCLQPQHYYVSLEIEDPDGKIVVRAGLSYEQAARMLLYNGNVECTLERYRDDTGKLVTEKVEPPETVHERMKERLKETQTSILKRLEDVRRDIYEMVNGDQKRNKGAMESLLSEVEVIKSHLVANQNFVVHQAEEELDQMQNNAAGQLGIFLQSKLGQDVPMETLREMLPITKDGKQLMLTDERPEVDNYELKPRKEKSIDEMTNRDVAERISRLLNRLERADAKLDLHNANAWFGRNDTVGIKYVSYQGDSELTLNEARRYLAFLMTIKNTSEFKKHFSL